MKLKSLTDTFLITNTPSTEETEEFDRHVLDHQYTLHWGSWRVWQTRTWSPILPPLKKLKSLADTYLITNIPSIKEADDFHRHVLEHQYTLHGRSWRVWQTRSWSPIHSPLRELKSLTDTSLITNIPSINEAEEFDRHVLDHLYTLHWRNWRVLQTRSWSPIHHPLEKLKDFTDTFLITNTSSMEEAEEFDRHVLDHQYTLHWGSRRVWKTRSWSRIYPLLMKLKSLTDTFLIMNISFIEEAESLDRHGLGEEYTIH